MDDVGKLVLFRDVVESGGFSRAAARRGLSHSTVSKHIKSLERSLGVQLLHRTSRVMSLTERGRVVLDYSRRVGGCVEELQRRLDELRGEVRGELRVASLVHVGKHIVQPAAAAFLREHPHARVQLSLSDAPLAFSRDGLDLAVRVGLQAESTLTARKLLNNEVCIVAAPALLARHGAPQHPSQLAALPTVGYRSAAVTITVWRYLEGGEHRSVEVTPRFLVNDGNALLDAARDGLGVAYLSRFAAREDLERGALVQLLPRVALPAYDPVYMLYASTDYAAPALAAFQRHLLARCEALAR